MFRGNTSADMMRHGIKTIYFMNFALEGRVLSPHPSQHADPSYENLGIRINIIMFTNNFKNHGIGSPGTVEAQGFNNVALHRLDVLVTGLGYFTPVKPCR